MSEEQLTNDYGGCLLFELGIFDFEDDDKNNSSDDGYDNNADNHNIEIGNPFYFIKNNLFDLLILTQYLHNNNTAFLLRK
nr:3150_t:CDS:2 [Entrophospora candida]